jgi:hypothetical protein
MKYVKSTATITDRRQSRRKPVRGRRMASGILLHFLLPVLTALLHHIGTALT